MHNENLQGKILWCLKQKKGIQLTEPSNNLCSAYLKKAANSLKSMNLNINGGVYDWAADAAYYARYHAIYALLQKCGIISEIHDCSIALMRFLFKGKIDETLLVELEGAKKQRIDLIYYTNRLVPQEEIRKNVEAAPGFVLEMEKIISEINSSEEINRLRDKLKTFMAV